MRAPGSSWVLIAASSLLAAACIRSEPLADRPPGVDEASWAPISATAGIVLTSIRNIPVAGALRFETGEAQETVPRLRSLQEGTGILMVKVGGAWTRVDLDLPDARLRPLL
jgi:hypothetical protein